MAGLAWAELLPLHPLSVPALQFCRAVGGVLACWAGFPGVVVERKGSDSVEP